MASRPWSLPVLLLALSLVIGACKKDAMATETMDEVTALTDRIVTTVHEASDKQAGVARAQALLDARKEALSARMHEIGHLRNIELSEEVQSAVLSGRVDNRAKMAQLEHELLTEIFKDAELEAAVSTLIDDHEAILKGE